MTVKGKNRSNSRATIKKLNTLIRGAIEDIDKHGHEDERTNCFIQTQCGDDAVVEPIISMWRITKHGQLTQVKEESFEYFQEFKHTKNGEMLLQLSYDKSIVSLGLVNDKYNGQISIMAWYTSNLKKV